MGTFRIGRLATLVCAKPLVPENRTPPFGGGPGGFFTLASIVAARE